jgi:hypothetical protein
MIKARIARDGPGDAAEQMKQLSGLGVGTSAFGRMLVNYSIDRD